MRGSTGGEARASVVQADPDGGKPGRAPACPSQIDRLSHPILRRRQRVPLRF